MKKVLSGLLFWSIVAFANGGNTVDCNALLQLPPIPRTVQPKYLIELESAGSIIAPSERIPNLTTGFYTYMINAKGEILLAEKYDVPKYMETGKGLATHKSLLKVYELSRMTMSADNIVAAGEFQVAFGSVVDISNKSGNFRGNSKRLRAAIQLMENRGLILDPDATIRPVDPAKEEDRGHTPSDRNFDEFHLEMSVALERDPNGVPLRGLYITLFELIKESAPGLSGRQAIAKVLELRNLGIEKTGNREGASLFYYPLLAAYSRDGIDFGILGLLRNDVAAEFEPYHEKYSISVPIQIRNVILGGESELNPQLKAKWAALATAFENLGQKPTP